MKIPLDFFLKLIKDFLSQAGFEKISKKIGKKLESSEEDYVC